jgi:hypothetical protein
MSIFNQTEGLMLQNRVDPGGNIIKTPARGVWMGNRGVIHSPAKEIIRPFKLKAWITCLLEFKGWHRPVMAPNRYTELFFMDEATAFAAGHRPCAECRRSDYKKFKSLWIKGNPEYQFDEKTRISEIDDILQRERIDGNHLKVTYRENLLNLPDGAFVRYENEAYLVRDAKLHLWTPSGYKNTIDPPKTAQFEVLTPKSIVNAIQSGYRPQMKNFIFMQA